jgi:predicted protein tyrosine phosphatase
MDSRCVSPDREVCKILVLICIAVMEIAVTTLAKAPALIRSGWPTKILSLVDPQTDLEETIKEQMVLFCEQGSLRTLGAARPLVDYVPFIIEWAQRLDDDVRLLVHCHAGIIRSPAAAIGILAARGVPSADAVAQIGRLRPFMLPAANVIERFDTELNLEGKLSVSLAAWTRQTVF